ncbi:MAG: DNA polymerase III subunit delta, partial [Eggerthellaceae bacterium]|nr:DNA polymerase III subunit delta [Eggerthellaceae bacterium]
RSNERLMFRTAVMEALGSLEHADDWDVCRSAAHLVTAAKAPLDEVRAAQEAELSENADFLAKSALRQIEARNKRALSAKSAESLRQLTSMTRSWLRDVIAVRAGAGELVVNVDVRRALEAAAARADEAQVVAAMEAVRRCDEALSYNVSPETCIDAMLFEIREVLYGSGSTH